MAVRKLTGRLGTAVLSLFFLILSPCAFADKPDDAASKGSRPAAEPVLYEDTVSRDASYDPVPVDVDLLYIGLAYDDDAVYTADLVNAEGLGFELGAYDEERVFHPFMELAASELSVRIEQNWYLLLDASFDSQAEAETVKSRFPGVIVKLDGAYRILLGPYRDTWDIGDNKRWYSLQGEAWHENCLAVYNGANELCYLYAGREDLALRAISNEKARTWYHGECYRGGFLFKRGPDGPMTVVNAVELEDYVKGVVPYEMSPSWPEEALKAQAVCARTYAAYNLHAYEEDYGFDLTDDTESQVYRGLLGADDLTDLAVDSTAGQFVRYRGELCEVYYFASDGGATEDGLHVFGSDRPYLAGKTDPFEQARDDAVIRWEIRRSGEEIGRRLRAYDHEIGEVVKIEASYSELGNVIAMTYYDRDGNRLALENRDSYKPLALDNCRFTISQDGEYFLFRGVGWGHSCGMSQWGANAMAEVYGCTAEEIIGFYFTGATIG